jgi:selenocysteine-specific elongation factor
VEPSSSFATRPGIIVGTAGHVDHGKTELIKALTGVDTDRLVEEKRRGLTIDLGFAPLDLPLSGRVGIVDVPGHQRFLKNMLAGVGGIDVALMVVAADEGVMPQTREHFEILCLLGIERLLVAVTKIDAAEADFVDLVASEVEDLLRGTSLEGSPIVKVSSVSGDGLEELIARLDETISLLPPRQIGHLPRLPVDRVFVLQGIGTVVTGSLTHGSIAAGEEVTIYPRGLRARVRHIQVHNRQENRVVAGHRVALNLTGLSREQIQRGDIISIDRAFEATRRLDVKVQAVGSDVIIKDWTRVRLYLGSAELLARLVILSDKQIRSGQEAFCQLRLESPAVAWMEDRFVLRFYSPPGLLGGGRILNPVPPQHKRFDPAVIERFKARDGGDLREIIVSALSGGPVRQETLSHSLRWIEEEIQDAAKGLEEDGRIVIRGSFYMLPEDLDRIERRAVDLVRDFHRRQPLKKGLSKEELKSRIDAPHSLVEELLSTSEQLELDGDLVRQRGQDVRFTPEQERERRRIESAFLAAELTPPDRDEVLKTFDRKVFYALVEHGVIVPLTKNIYLHRRTLERAKERIGEALSKRGSMRLSEMKDLWGTTRKYAVPLAEHLDRIGFTQRDGDKRSLVGDS